MKIGSDGYLIDPEKKRRMSAALVKQVVEWRCLSFREKRVMLTGKGTLRALAIGSSGADEAVQICTASFRYIFGHEWAGDLSEDEIVAAASRLVRPTQVDGGR